MSWTTLLSRSRLGSRHILGVMVESHLVEGKQPIPKDLSQLKYGQSITDACVSFDQTATMLRKLASAIAPFTSQAVTR
jgi:3-deoxy-7-phosphoheptulonate synthase